MTLLNTLTSERGDERYDVYLSGAVYTAARSPLRYTEIFVCKRYQRLLTVVPPRKSVLCSRSNHFSLVSNGGVYSKHECWIHLEQVGMTYSFNGWILQDLFLTFVLALHLINRDLHASERIALFRCCYAIKGLRVYSGWCVHPHQYAVGREWLGTRERCVKPLRHSAVIDTIERAGNFKMA